MAFVISVACCYILSGFYIVRPGEQAIVLLFGKLITPHPVQPGVHWRLPLPFGKVIKENVLQRRRISIGAEQIASAVGRTGTARLSQFLSGDANIVSVNAVVQYKVADVAAYALHCSDAEGLLKALAEAALTYVMANRSIDSALTVGRFTMQNETKELIRRLADAYDIGISIISVNFQTVLPPPEVADAFHEVTRAREECQRLINEADSYRSERIPEARGTAQKIIADAESYGVRVVNQAIGDARKFTAMANEYRHSPKITSARLYIEAMEQILPRMRKYVLDEELQSGKHIDLTIFEQLKEGQQGDKSKQGQ